MTPNISSIKWIDFNTIEDPRGSLTSIEGEFDIPFDIKRIFYMHDVIQDRGGHAHIDTDQVIIASISELAALSASDNVKTKPFAY